MSDELTATVFGAVQSLSNTRKANLLLDTSLALIAAGRYGPEVENYLEVYLRAPDLPRNDVVRALLARGNARKAAGESLQAKAEQDFRSPSHTTPPRSGPRSKSGERIASYIPRYHLRTWLSVSAFHRDIAVRMIFHTLDLYFGSDDQEALNRGLDIFDRVKADPVFASRVKSLRLHWAYEEGDMLDLMIRIFRSTLPEFKALRDFEWIGYPEMSAEIVQTVLASHPHLHGLGLIGWHFDAIGVSDFTHLRKFTLRAEDDDGFAPMNEVRTVLDVNAPTLTHLVLGAYLARQHSWDSAFGSSVIRNLTHLDLVDTRISPLVLARVASAGALESLTLHGTFEDPAGAAVVFNGDHVLDDDGEHTLLPYLHSFRFILVGHDDHPTLYRAVTHFLRARSRLRRLDLGNCPWELLREVLPGLSGVRVLGVRIAHFTVGAGAELRPLNEFAPSLRPFPALSFLHLQTPGTRRPEPNLTSDKEFALHTELWVNAARGVARVLGGLDFLGWHGEHYVVVRRGGAVGFGHAPTPPPPTLHTPPLPHTHAHSHSPSPHPSSARAGSCGVESVGEVELKELPCRKRLDCAKGVDLGGEDAAWLERKDVPMDYETPAGNA
ncbi:hypothetical protein MSAN_01901500 [Mycena sanguinolenta]|uniref:Uncharacterized protein n=1 Tax=Mycena sanguinolenta TaxID=230812 RepID=A0A8H7CPE0_9AGAR|nr:hypothetical protein MSAN_01901500 [Mycena sanguinolenta]